MRRTITVLSVLAVLAAIFGAGVFLASKRVPDFYEEALALDEAVAVEASQTMVRQAAELASDVRNEDDWQATFSEDQLNGWLAVDRVKNYPTLLPPEFADPRVSVEPGNFVVACRYSGSGVSTVLSLDTDVYLERPNVIAVRLKAAWAGAVPVPLSEVLDGIKRAATQLEWPLEWQQADGDPVALITIPPPRDPRQPKLQLEKLELRDDAVFIEGRSERRR